MNIDIIKNEISKHINVQHFFVYNGSRGHTEEYYGVIIKLYPRVFTIKTSAGHIKSISYSDYALKNLKIY